MSNNSKTTTSSKISVERVYLYANGTCEVLGRVDVDKERSSTIELVIPERNASEVLSSLSVTGVSVSVTKPATVKLLSASDGQLRATGADPYLLFEQLAGADIALDLANGKIVNGKLMGIVRTSTAHGSNPDQLMVKVGTDIKTIELSFISKVSFVSDDIQSRINSALEQNLQKISPASATISLELSSFSGGTAHVSYVLSTNPWVMSYAIHCKDTGLDIEAFAHVYNSTSEDWKDAAIVASTARPQDFIPLVRQPEIPKRQTVALGETELDEPAVTAKSATRRSAVPFSDSARGQAEGMGGLAFAMSASTESAYEVEASSTEYAGTVEYLANGEITVPAGSNSNINVMRQHLDDAKQVAYYDDRNGSGKVLAALSGVNTTGTLLTRGCGVVHKDNRFLGRCIVPELRDGEEFFVPYGRESRITVAKVRDTGDGRKYGSIVIGDGVIKTEIYENATVAFKVENTSSEPFVVVIDLYKRLRGGHDHRISASAGSVSKTDSGYRLTLSLEGEESQTVTITESVAYPATVKIDTQYQDAARLVDSLLIAGAELEKAPEFKQYLAIRAEIAECQTSLTSITSGRDKLLKDMDLLKQNLSALSNVPGQSEQISAWGKELVDLTNEHKRLGDKISDTSQKLVALRSSLRLALEAVSLAWSRNRGY